MIEEKMGKRKARRLTNGIARSSYVNVLTLDDTGIGVEGGATLDAASGQLFTHFDRHILECRVVFLGDQIPIVLTQAVAGRTPNAP